jgi:hypothetical protein
LLTAITNGGFNGKGNLLNKVVNNRATNNIVNSVTNRVMQNNSFNLGSTNPLSLITGGFSGSGGSLQSLASGGNRAAANNSRNSTGTTANVTQLQPTSSVGSGNTRARTITNTTSSSSGKSGGGGLLKPTKSQKN